MAYNRTRLPRRDPDSHSVHHTTDSEEYDDDLTWWEKDKLKEKRGLGRTNTTASLSTGTTPHKRSRFPTVGTSPQRETRTPESIHRRDFYASKNDTAWWERGKQGGSRTSSPTRSRLNLTRTPSRTTNQTTSHSDIETLRLTALEFLKDSRRIEDDYHNWQGRHKETLSKELRNMKNEREAQKARKRGLEAELKQLKQELEVNRSHTNGLRQALTNLIEDAVKEIRLIEDLNSTLTDLQNPVETVHHLRDGFKGDITNPKKSYIQIMKGIRDRLKRKRNLEVYNEHDSSYNDKDRLTSLQERIQKHDKIEREIEALSKANNVRYA